ncbi:MAG TPA: type IV pilus modification protein PilV [Lautropia sp.]|jgi:type IV pilus assembly protein PilV|nr:type IV pilus modification protein PilV [Lautropia sp.]
MRRRQQEGFTLIEALVSMLIFSIGILGLVGMQTVAARVSTDARFRSEAAAAADELLARMQSSNPRTRATDFAAPNGAAFMVWVRDRLQGSGSGLPNVAATVTFGVVDDFGKGGPDARTVRIVIGWSPPKAQRDGSGLASALGRSRQHVTVSALYD